MFDLLDELLFPADRYSLLPKYDSSFALQFNDRPGLPLRVVTRGRTQYFNYREEDLPHALVETAPLTMRTLTTPLVTRFEEDKPEQAAMQDAPRHWSAAIYTADGELLPEFSELSERFNGKRRDGYNFNINLPRVDRARASKARRLKGRHVYMGYLRAHFGHFLLESLARAWAMLDLEPGTKILFHPSIPKTYPIPVFAREILAAMDVDPVRVVLAHEDLVPDELIVPTPQFWIEWKGSPGMCLAFDRVRERLTRLQSATFLPRRVYLTRRLMGAPLRRRAAQFAHNSRRHDHLVGKNLLNEDEVESLFAARGFDIIAPETRSLREQIILVANASEIAGVTGSALHLALFNGNPESKLIALDVRSSVNQHIVEQVRGTRAFHMNCVKSRDELGQPQLDCALIWQALKEIL